MAFVLLRVEKALFASFKVVVFWVWIGRLSAFLVVEFTRCFMPLGLRYLNLADKG